MVLEIAEFSVTPGQEDDFAAAYHSAKQLLHGTPGFLSARMTRGIETTNRFVLLIEWDTLESHTVGFRESDLFVQWRQIIGPFFAAAPRVQHSIDVADGS
ncbi:MAG: Antibiotic biosynthesis monooxygenase [Pseudonocardia sp.]|jgi:heme-degrading monooxygenase HmoA|nr:Antibiotic biosynthesis monooxygenase [Pseudonocardia sp.]